MRTIILAPMLAFLAGCSASQLAGYTSAADATTRAINAFGNAVISADCQYGNIVAIVARDLNASSKINARLAQNSAVLKTICPLVTGTPAVTITTQGA